MQVGDVVVIKPNLSVDDDYAGSPGYVNELEMYRGQRVTVNWFNNDWFTVGENNWTWSVRWIKEENELPEITDEEFAALLNGD